MKPVLLALGCGGDFPPKPPKQNEVLQQKGFPPLEKVFDAYVDGDVDSLFPGNDGETVYAVRRHMTSASQWSEPVSSLIGIPVSKNSIPRSGAIRWEGATDKPALELSMEVLLSHDAARFYSWGSVGPYIGVIYTSDGLSDGVSFVDPSKGSDQQPIDCRIISTAKTERLSPTAILQREGAYYILAKNGLQQSSHGVFGRFDSSALTGCNFNTLASLPFPNPAAFAFLGGEWLIGDAANSLAPVRATANLLHLNAETYQPTKTETDIPDGFALNGPAPVRDGVALFTGNSSDGRSITLASPQTGVKKIRIPKVTNQYVGGGVFVGLSHQFILFSAINIFPDPKTGQSVRGIESYLLNTETEEPVLLEQVPSLYSDPFIQLGDHLFCNGAVGAVANADGSTRTRINCWTDQP